MPGTWNRVWKDYFPYASLNMKNVVSVLRCFQEPVAFQSILSAAPNEGRISLNVKSWLYKVVTSGISWEGFPGVLEHL